ncbi:MAG: type VI secretion system tip protein VgrG [Gammaproteobacteria bacterium]
MSVSPADKSSDVVKLSIFIDGNQMNETYQVVSVSVVRAINKIPYAKVTLLDGDMPDQDFPISNSADFMPGSEIKINAGYGQDEETIYQGIVVKHGIKVSGNNNSRLIIECRDKAVAMTVGRKNANYIDSKDSDIISSILATYSALTADVAATETEYKELVQYYCTDWDFMLTRAEVNGRLVYVESGKVSVKAPQTDAVAELKVTYGEDLIEFNAEVDARTQLLDVSSVSWDPNEQQAIEENAGQQTLNAQGDLTAKDLAAVLDVKTFRLQSPVSMEKTALKAWAAAQQVKAGLAKIRGRMKFQGSALATIGSMIELDGVGNRFNGSVFVSSVTHDITGGHWLSEVEFGMSADWFAEQKKLVAPPASGFIPGIEGLQIGVVMKLDEDPEAQHRVQVAVPTLQAETEGVWARLSNFYASNTFGVFFVPEIGDEVVLGYLNNDPSNPVILGSLYSSKNTPPYQLTADNFIKSIVTKSQLKIEFDDENKVTTIITPGNNKVVLSDDEKSILLHDQNDNKVELSGEGIVLESPKDIKITAKGKISFDATDVLGMKSAADVVIDGMNINLTANTGFTAKGNASAELSASGQTTIKGAMVMIN